MKSRTFVKALYGVVGKGNQELGRSSQVESQSCTRLTRFLDQLKSVQRRSKCVKTVQITQQIKGFYTIPVSANVKHINIAMVVTSKERLSCGVESNLQESNRFTLTSRCASDDSNQNSRNLTNIKKRNHDKLCQHCETVKTLEYKQTI